MSGDVQPRKRKDKRRKKGQLEARRSEEYQEEKAANILRQSSRSEDEGLEDIGLANPDEVIHVQKDALLGGNICAKVVFFCLLGAIGVMVGLIIVEYRGATDAETHSAIDSPWSQMLDGWVDSTSSIHHDDHGHEDEGLEDASGEEHEHSDEDILHGHDDEDGEHYEHDNDEHNDDDDDDDDEHEDTEEDVSSEKHQDVLEEENDNDDEDNVSGEEEEEDDDDDEDEEDNENEDDEANKSEESFDEDNLDQDDEDLEKDTISEEVDDTNYNVDDKEEDEEEDDEVENIPGIAESEEDDNDEVKAVNEDEKFLRDEASEEAEDGEEDKPFDDLQEEDDEQSEDQKITEETEIEDKNEEGVEGIEEEDETSGVALKFGVGVALVVVAHVVLVRKWNSAGEESVPAAPKGIVPSNEPSPLPESEPHTESLTRRQTLVAPPPVEELPPVKPPNPESEFSNDEDEEEEEEEESEKIKQTLEELKETYSHLTPEGSDLEEEDDYVSKLSSKNYTYTPTPPESEQSEPDDEEEEEEEEDPMRQWQSRQAAHLLAEEVEDVQTGTEEEESDDEHISSSQNKKPLPISSDEESDDEPPPPVQSVRRRGPQEADQLDQQSESEPEKIYVNAEITNQYEWDFQEDLDLADQELNEGHVERAFSLYTSLLARAPYSPRAHHGKAKSLDRLAEKQQSNQLLVKAIMAYKDALNMPDIPDKLFIEIANRTIDRMRFKGMHLDAVTVHNKLISRFHNVPLYRCQLAVTYLMVNRLQDAKVVLEMSLQRWPQDGLSNCLFGLLLKLQGHHSLAVPHLKLGIDSNENGTQESNFFFHLGDALVRIGKPEEAMKVLFTRVVLLKDFFNLNIKDLCITLID